MSTTTMPTESLLTARRTCYCGEVRESHIGQSVVLKGWLHKRRDLGGIVFIDLRDREGIVQTRFNPGDISEQLLSQVHHLRSEFCLAIRGDVQQRPSGTENKNLASGTVEVVVRDFEVLSTSKPLPFQIDERDNAGEDIRLAHRYRDLRRAEMTRNMVLRHKVCKATRDYLCDNGFLEFETPILTKATPEGARDFLVPSRLAPGNFYALPQSPQLFKQLLMVSGFDKYFQIARCFRDEDLRANRQPEFTQIDVEMSFVTQDDVIGAMERLIAHVFKESIGFEVPVPIQRMTYDEAMLRYGSDKPDLRFGLEVVELTKIVSTGCNFQVFNNIVKVGGAVRALCLQGKASEFSNMQLRPDSKWSQEVHRECGIKAYAWFKVTEGGALESSITKFFEPAKLDEIKAAMNAQPGDIIFLVANDKARVVADMVGRLRLLLGRQFNLINKSDYKFTWVVDFPGFEFDDGDKRWVALHHPFTTPRVEDLDKLGTDRMGEIYSVAYDLACNGEELGGGSIRIHRTDVQQKVFEAIGLTNEEAQAKFGFLLEALQYGPPPHGGIAFGVDRLIMLLTGEDNIRAVIPFPKTQTGSCPLTNAPSTVPDAALKDLHIKTIPLPKKEEKKASMEQSL